MNDEVERQEGDAERLCAEIVALNTLLDNRHESISRLNERLRQANAKLDARDAVLASANAEIERLRDTLQNIEQLDWTDTPWLYYGRAVREACKVALTAQPDAGPQPHDHHSDKDVPTTTPDDLKIGPDGYVKIKPRGRPVSDGRRSVS